MTELDGLAAELVAALIAAGKTVATAESCTGGWIGKSITDVPGSSAAYGYGLVTYSNEAKTRLVGVSDSVLEEHGAVSEPVVSQMASGVRELSSADLAVSVSGVAGPGGGSDEKPIGTVWIAWADGDAVATQRCHFDGDRDSIRRQTVRTALKGLLERL